MTAVRAARRLTRLPAELTRAATARLATHGWQEGSHLFVVGDRIGWSIDDDTRQLGATARRLGVPVGDAAWAPHARRQSVFLPSHFSALQPRWLDSTHRLGLAYFHGRPGTEGHPEFDEVLDRLRRAAGRVARVQVTHGEMHDLVVAAGVDPGRVFRIPIGIDIESFPAADPAARSEARRQLDLPAGAFVVGSFVKDGVGWGDGLEPKAVKAPDVLAGALALLREGVPELVVLLTGPARGFVRRELHRLGIAVRQARPLSRSGLGEAYRAVDVTLVASRQEGGPKSALESLASGVPLVSTRVGQVPELTVDGESALHADVDDTEALSAQVLRVYADADLRARLVRQGRRVAERYAYPQLDASWAELFEGFVTRVRA
jgi:glycosyltransferase involved in cell wall biosynthesis